MLSVSGHAGMAERGRDIVCAAASILAYTLAEEVRAALARGLICKSPRLEFIYGDACIICEPAPEARAELIHAWELIIGGYRLLCERYPEFISIHNNGDMHTRL